jgi:hypothetical protein
MADFKETCIEYLDADKYATFCSSETKWINKIRKLHDLRPNEVIIIKEPENNDGMLVSHVPKSWMKISPPASRNMTDEQRAAAAERLRLAREKKDEKENINE